MLEIGEMSRNRQLIVRAYLHNARRYFEFAGSQEAVSKGLEFSTKALDLAKSSGLDDYTALAYTYQARGYRNTGDVDKALNLNNLAVALAGNGKNDSVKVISYLSLGTTYLLKNEKLLAFRNYLTALDIAEQDKRYTLLRNVYTNLSLFYGTINDFEKAKDFEFKKVNLQRANHRFYDLLDTYNSLGTLYRNAKQYDLSEKFYEESIALADSLKMDKLKLASYLQLVNLYLSNSQFEKGLAYFRSHEELGEFIKQAGMDFFLYQGYGSMYTYVNKMDSAAYYFKLAEPGFETRASKANKYWFYSSYAYYFRKRGDYDHAVGYWLKAKQLGDEIGSLDYQQESAS